MNNLIKAMTYNYPDEIPISVGILPAAWKYHAQELVRLANDYPDFISYIPDLDNIPMSDSYRYGNYTDEWGCIWSNIEEGMESIVTGHPVATKEDIHRLEIPKNKDGRLPHGFMYMRLLDLRGFEEAMIDFAEEYDELQILINKVLEYNCIQIHAALPRVGEVMYFGDDLGMQHSIAIGKEKWRKYLKPCYKKMYDIVKQADKYIYMHTDGYIIDIMPDLMECGVTMINPQYRANGLENLVHVCRGKIPINLDLDRQLFPFANPSEIDDHVRECVEALYLPQGGLGLSIEIGQDVPIENIAALFDSARKYKNGY